MNAARFAAMKPTACFVNISRPMLLNEEALAAALRSDGSPARRLMSAPHPR